MTRRPVIRVHRVSKMTPEIAAELYDLDERCFPRDTREDTSAGAWWLALDGPRVVGYASALADGDPNKWSDGYLYITRMGVLPEARGQGIQRRLGRAQIAYAHRLGCKGVHTYTLWYNAVSANNLIAIGFRRWVPTDPWVGAAEYWRITF